MTSRESDGPRDMARVTGKRSWAKGLWAKGLWPRGHGSGQAAPASFQRRRARRRYCGRAAVRLIPGGLSGSQVFVHPTVPTWPLVSLTSDLPGPNRFKIVIAVVF